MSFAVMVLVELAPPLFVWETFVVELLVAVAAPVVMEGLLLSVFVDVDVLLADPPVLPAEAPSPPPMFPPSAPAPAHWLVPLPPYTVELTLLPPLLAYDEPVVVTSLDCETSSEADVPLPELPPFCESMSLWFEVESAVALPELDWSTVVSAELSDDAAPVVTVGVLEQSLLESDWFEA